MPRSKAQGFTLIELMIVVCIVAILASLATYAVRRYLDAAKTSEAIELINSARAAQETYKDETFRYLNISADLTTNNSFHPAAPGVGKRSWVPAAATPLSTGWTELGVNATGPVQFGYACVSGLTGVGPPALGLLDAVPADLNFPTAPTGPWYVIKAIGDRDGNNVRAALVGSSFTNEIYSERETE